MIYLFNFKVGIIANCEVNSSYRNCKVVNHERNAKQFFSKENLIHPHYIQIISTFYSSIADYYQGKYCLYPKLHRKMKLMFLNS